MSGAGAALAIVVVNVENRLIYEAIVHDVSYASEDVGDDVLGFHYEISDPGRRVNETGFCAVCHTLSTNSVESSCS